METYYELVYCVGEIRGSAIFPTLEKALSSWSVFHRAKSNWGYICKWNEGRFLDFNLNEYAEDISERAFINLK